MSLLTPEWWYKNIKNYYELGIYKEPDVKKYWSPLKKISEDQYKEIVGIVEEPAAEEVKIEKEDPVERT
ncbi:XkdX family protein [Bacillus paranthracis]|uniref:XkdX family protein n=1 Tax=Bacillus cereus group TaxID=86661 RepID=UPI0022E63388|nr:XkdX family protein [Bacillus cereus group sp. BY25LC]MDA1828535.1 XkdX family protein [Bacillus cereus group sp. BY25LC]